ncbi:MAG: DUF1579 family protein [Gemmatimonadetes bacterium]|nr:DUF1579 family protein [Gemmatimonadota bacterium]
MPTPEKLLSLAGHWVGESALWLHPGAEARRSSARAHITAEAEGQALCVRYAWADGDAPQSGLLLLVGDAATDAVTAAWTDSWHYARQLMHCVGTSTGDSTSVRGSYAAPPGPDWGWRLALEAVADGTCVLRMFNITPDGEEALAVEMPLSRAP